MDIVLGILVGLFALMFLIVAHEFGHFLMAKRSGVRVKEFGIGFPPRAVAWLVKKDEKGKRKWEKFPKSEWKKEQDSLIFSINFLPIGGFCAMDGESDADTKKGTFGSVSYWKKTKILFGGVAMNWLVAFLILTVLCWTGLPTILENQFSIKSDEKITITEPVQIAEVLEGSPAETAGFQSGDIIKSVKTAISSEDTTKCINSAEKTQEENSQTKCQSYEELTVYSSQNIINFNASHAGEQVIYEVIHNCETEDNCNNQTEYLEATLNPSDSEYLLGVTMNYGDSETRYTWSAPIVAAGLTVQITGETFKGLWNLLVNLVTGAARQVSTDSSVRQEGKNQISEATEGVSGIVGIIGGYFPNLIHSGPTMLFLFIAVISISLACMNVLPIPALDGGRWLMITIARLQHKRLSQETEQKIVARAFIVLLALMVVITILDIIHLF